MASKNQHVVKREDGWAVRGEGNQRDTSHHRTQAEAEQAAKSIAINQRSEVLIHGEDGRIRERNSYGNDPYPPKGSAKPLVFKPGAKAAGLFFACRFRGGWIDAITCFAHPFRPLCPPVCPPPVSQTSLTFSQLPERRKT